MRTGMLAVLVAILVGTAGCGGSGKPVPLRYGTFRPLVVAPDGRLLIGAFNCGGRLTARETSSQVTVTRIEPDIAPGAASCATRVLSVRLSHALGTRIVIDGVTHHPVHVWRWITPTQVCRDEHIGGASSGQFSNDGAVRQALLHLPDAASGVLLGRPDYTPAAWCWLPGRASSIACPYGRSPGPRQWEPVVVDAVGFQYFSHVCRGGSVPPTAPPS